MFSIRKQHEQAFAIATKSHSLWKGVNLCIAKILKNTGHRSRKNIAKKLYSCAGPKTKGEPVCLINFRAAAKAVEEGNDMSFL